MGRTGSLVVFNTSIAAAGSSAFVTNTVGFPGVLTVEATQIEANFQLIMKGPQGRDINIASSKVFTTACAFGPLYFPAGQYGIKSVAGSSINVMVAIHPTL